VRGSRKKDGHTVAEIKAVLEGYDDLMRARDWAGIDALLDELNFDDLHADMIVAHLRSTAPVRQVLKRWEVAVARANTSVVKSHGEEKAKSLFMGLRRLQWMRLVLK
jgi:hypothetical protein